MIKVKLLGRLLLAFILAFTFVNQVAYADRPRGHGGRTGHSSIGFGLYFGAPYTYPYYPLPYYPYSYYPPPVVINPVPQQPPVYIEQSPAVSEKNSSERYYWYYCEKSESYYPYVKECPDGWQKLAPTPPP